MTPPTKQSPPAWDGTERRGQQRRSDDCSGRCDDVRDLTEMIKTGFPDGDLHGHRKVHEDWIKEAKERVEFRKKIIEKVLLGAMGAAGSGVLFVLVDYWRMKTGG